MFFDDEITLHAYLRKHEQLYKYRVAGNKILVAIVTFS